jgi:hypothetical protein
MSGEDDLSALLADCRDSLEMWRDVLERQTAMPAPHARDLMARIDRHLKQRTADLGDVQGGVSGPVTPVALGAAHAHYTSTACIHALHLRCRDTCKWCDRACGCDCHDYEP